MTRSSSASARPDLSVVIPAYNSAPWIPSTLQALAAAVDAAGIHVEVLVVDDGSVDGTATAAAAEAGRFAGQLRVISQENAGRFLARARGVGEARAELVLLLDSRVLIGPQALAHALPLLRAGGPAAWNGHIVPDSRAPLVGRFWEVPTHLFWGGYLRAPRPYDLDAENFDAAPKGTTMFLTRRDILVDAFDAARPTVGTKLVSDDTKVLRWVAENHGIHLDPAFDAVYRPRTTVRGFLAHSFDRGTLFVDSYAGTTRARTMILALLAAAPVAIVLAAGALVMRGRPAAAAVVGLAPFVAAASAALPARRRRAPGRAVAAYLLYLLPFAAPFWAGLARGVVLHRSALLRGLFSSSKAPS